MTDTRPREWRHSVKWVAGQFYPKVYSRFVRRPYTGEELRKLRAERGVGRPPKKVEVLAWAA
jgi:hypothetical protein